MQSPKHLTSLDAWEKYVRLNEKSQFLRKYWYLTASGPFALAVFLIMRFYPHSTNKLWDVLVVASLAWGVLVAGYSMSIIVSLLFIRCPRCSWRFGLGDWCNSCGLPRHHSPPQ